MSELVYCKKGHIKKGKTCFECKRNRRREYMKKYRKDNTSALFKKQQQKQLGE